MISPCWTPSDPIPKPDPLASPVLPHCDYWTESGERRSAPGRIRVAIRVGFEPSHSSESRRLRTESGQLQAAGAGVRELIFKANGVDELCAALARRAQTVVEKETSS